MSNYYSLGLCGYPLVHSFSPLLHKAALLSCGLTGNYSLFPINPHSNLDALLKILLDKLLSKELHGLNITIPFKQKIISLLDDLTPTAFAIGAVNTILCKNGRLIGDNTDAPGFIADLRNLPLKGPANALVLGAGGAARAVVFALLQAGWQVHIASRRASQAEELSKTFLPMAISLSVHVKHFKLDADSLQAALPECTLIVNTTPAGMLADTNETPWPKGLLFPRSFCLYDLIYNPPLTTLMRAAQLSGVPTRNGLGMLVEQAAVSFERWTGFTPSRIEMLKNLPIQFQPVSRST